MAAGALLSPILLIMDLGRPELFLNMLRVFKHQSPMSVGAWILSIFSSFAVPACLAFRAASAITLSPPRSTANLNLRAQSFTVGAAISGLGLATYTGVLIGATAIPAWFLHRTFCRFISALPASVAPQRILELFGFHIRPLFSRPHRRDHRNAALDLARDR